MHFSFSSGVHLAAVVVVGPWGAALVAAFGVAFVDRLRGVPLRNVGFNASAFAVPCVVGGYLYVLVGGSVGMLVLPSDLPALAALAIVAYGTNLLLVSTVIGLATGQRPVALAGETASGQGFTAVSEAGFGIALAYFAIYAPWVSLALAPLVIGAYRAHALLERHRRETTQALETFARIVDERDAFTSDHSARVATLVAGLAHWAGLSTREVARLRWAGRLHDLGKVVVDTAVLHKPGRLDESEWEILRRHPRLSARIIRRFELASNEALAVEHHHERYDGKGYYKAPSSPIAAHILTVADSFDAMTSDRPYRQGRAEEAALVEIEQASGSQFHPIVAKAFAAYLRGTPVEVALTKVELRELGNLWTVEHERRRPRWATRPTPQSAGVFLAVLGLGLLLAGLHLPAWIALGGAAAALVWSERSTALRRRVLTGLQQALRLPGDTERADAFVALLSERSGLRWAGIIDGGRYEVGGLRHSWLGDGPAAEALTTWLARALGHDDLAFGDGAVAGIEGWLACLPVGERRSPNAYLVLQFDASPSRPVTDALRDCADTLAPALAGLSSEPLQPRLTAVG